MDFFRRIDCTLDSPPQIHFGAGIRNSWPTDCFCDMDYFAMAAPDFRILLADILVGCSQGIFVCPSPGGFGGFRDLESNQKIKNANEPMHLIPVPSGLLAWLLLPLRYGRSHARSKQG